MIRARAILMAMRVAIAGGHGQIALRLTRLLARAATRSCR